MITQSQLSGMASDIMSAKEKWLEFWLSRLLPPVCVLWAKEGRHLDFIADYLKRRDVRILRKIGQTRETLMQGDRIIATFEFKTTRQ